MPKNCTSNQNWKAAQLKTRETQIILKNKREEEYNKNPVRCLNCSNSIPYSKYPKKRKFCTTKCAASYNNFLRPIRTDESRLKSSIAQGGQGDLKILYESCLYCQVPFPSRTRNKYCSKKCNVEYNYENNIKKWKNGLIDGGDSHGVHDFVKRYIREKYDNRCAECGWCKIHPISKKSPLQVDHIDGNPDNHLEQNLILICPNCHSLTPTYCARNKGKGRKYRRVQYKMDKIKELELDLKIKELQQLLL